MLGDFQLKDNMFMGSIINVTIAVGLYSPQKGDNKLARVLPPPAAVCSNGKPTAFQSPAPALHIEES